MPAPTLAKTPATDNAARFAVIEWQDRQKGESLQAFITLLLPSGMALYECTYHVRADGSRWVGLPARSYTKAGETKPSWFRLVDFPSRDTARRFQIEALAAVDE